MELAQFKIEYPSVGVILYWLYTRTNDYRCCIIVHVLTNLFVYIVLYNCFNLSFLRWIQFVS